MVMAKHPKPSLRDSIGNLRRAVSSREAILGLFSNTLTKMRRADSCCGNYGDPGC